jgi:hypothetical protein
MHDHDMAGKSSAGHEMDDGRPQSRQVKSHPMLGYCEVRPRYMHAAMDPNADNAVHVKTSSVDVEVPSGGSITVLASVRAPDAHLSRANSIRFQHPWSIMFRILSSDITGGFIACPTVSF